MSNDELVSVKDKRLLIYGAFFGIIGNIIVDFLFNATGLNKAPLFTQIFGLFIFIIIMWFGFIGMETIKPFNRRKKQLLAEMIREQKIKVEKMSREDPERKTLMDFFGSDAKRILGGTKLI